MHIVEGELNPIVGVGLRGKEDPHFREERLEFQQKFAQLFRGDDGMHFSYPNKKLMG